ncbi:MAG: hypothetical protein CVT82_06775 [Alphaproteobacteria bacterium HGW-Alphaproteobacteria-4]|jgi:hypothetical protein|nr:MAG: hypothetical protein CVT82_06775 [Alphaproteobacteria bacterium HGW-Alphaproteobacteria-4]
MRYRAGQAGAPHHTNHEGITMDYGKSGVAPKGKNAPRHTEHNAKGTEQNPFGARFTKAELLARMKAAAEAKKKG